MQHGTRGSAFVWARVCLRSLFSGGVPVCLRPVRVACVCVGLVYYSGACGRVSFMCITVGRSFVCVCVCSMCTGLVFCIRRPVIVCGLINVCICVSTPITGLPPSTVSFGRTLMPCPLVCGRAWSSILLNSLLHDCKCIDDHEHL